MKKSKRSKTVQAWLATDPAPTILGHRPTCLFFGRKKPVIIDGYWRQANSGGRWPVQNAMRQKPGELWRVAICLGNEKGQRRARHGSAYSREILNQIKASALKIKGATSVSHIYPRAYCIAKPAPMCAVFVTPWVDAEPQVRQPDYSSSHTVGHGVEKVKVGDWCAIAYVTTPGMGTQWVVSMPSNSSAETR